MHLTSLPCAAVNSAKHLPEDHMSHQISHLSAEVPMLPLCSTDLVSQLLWRQPSITYHVLRTPLVQLFLADWLDISPPVPLSYLDSICLTPHTFTALPRYISGHIHQMRTGKLRLRYLPTPTFLNTTLLLVQNLTIPCTLSELPPLALSVSCTTPSTLCELRIWPFMGPHRVFPYLLLRCPLLGPALLPPLLNRSFR